MSRTRYTGEIMRSQLSMRRWLIWTLLAAAAVPMWGSAAAQGDSDLVVEALAEPAAPCQYRTVDVFVHVETPDGMNVSDALVTSEWNYRTTTSYEIGRTDAAGNAELERRISRATPDYPVWIEVSATADDRTGVGWAVFVPRDCT